MFKYHLIKDTIILAIIAASLYIGWKAYEYGNTKFSHFERTLTEMGTGISIDNQRKAKIAKGAEMILSRNPKLPYEIAINYSELFVDEADKYTNVDFVLLISIASQESAFKYKVQSPVGAKGLMQIMPMTAMDMCEYLRMTYADSMLFDAKYNIRLGARYINQLMIRFDNDTAAAIAAYNGGEGAGAKYKAGLPIFEETQKYIPAVLGYKKKYSKLL